MGWLILPRRVWALSLMAYEGGAWICSGKLLQAAMPDLKAVMERSNLGEYSTAAFGLRLSAEEVVMRFFGEHSAEVGKLMAAGSTGIGKAAPLATYLPPETMAVTRFSMNPVVFSQQVQKGLQPEQKQAYDQAVQESTNVITGAPFGAGKDSPLWADAKAKIKGLGDGGKLTPDEAKALEASAKAALIDAVKGGALRG